MLINWGKEIILFLMNHHDLGEIVMPTLRFEPKKEPIPYTDQYDPFEDDDTDEDYDQDHDED